MTKNNKGELNDCKRKWWAKGIVGQKMVREMRKPSCTVYKKSEDDNANKFFINI